MAAAQPLTGIYQLLPLDKVSIRQKMALFVNNKYVVTAPDGKPILYAKENVNMVNVMLAGKNRAFRIDVFDTQNDLVMKLRRPYTFGPDKMDVVVCGQLVSIVRQEVTFFKPVLKINDGSDRRLFRVKGPVSTAGECDFRIYSGPEHCIGVIRKKWGGFAREAFTDSDNFEIRFPQDLDVRYKAAIIGTCFLIDFLYYEN